MDLVLEAGRRILPIYGREISVELKDDRSPLTEADRLAHEILCKGLQGVVKDCPVVSEESADNRDVAGRDQFWLVDPLDGTKEFLKKSGEFTVNVALIRGGRPVLGVVHAPAIGVSYFAEEGVGAYRIGEDQVSRLIRVRRADAGKLSVVASRDHAGPMVRRMLDRLPGATCKSIGSSLKFCLVAEGEADIYLRDVPTMEWDTAAAQCVVESAGGRLLTLDGKPLTYGKSDLRNPSILTLGDPTLRWQEFATD